MAVSGLLMGKKTTESTSSTAFASRPGHTSTRPICITSVWNVIDLLVHLRSSTTSLTWKEAS